MTEKNPLDLSHVIVKYNKRGRPKMDKLITFSPEPKSMIISHLINQKKKEAHQENVANLERTEYLKEAQMSPNSDISPKSFKISHIINQNTKETHDKNVTDLQRNGDSQKPQFTSNSETPSRVNHQQYYCDYSDCSYACKLACNLIKHKRTHTAEKPYLCDQCCFRSNFVNSLKVHKRIHTTERPYSCKHCNYRCNSSSNLKKHSLHKHSEVPKT